MNEEKERFLQEENATLDEVINKKISKINISVLIFVLISRKWF